MKYSSIKSAALALGLCLGPGMACGPSQSAYGPQRAQAPYGVQAANGQPLPQPPMAVAMDPVVATGLWKTNFGPVKIVSDTKSGHTDGLMGVWVYDRENREVIGFFSGRANGNVLEFTWNEPMGGNQPMLEGAGYLVFDPAGRSYTGKWWTNNRDREGEWYGAREEVAATWQSPN